MRILNVRDNNHMHTAANGMASNTAMRSVSHDRESEQDASPRLSPAPALAGPGTTRANRRLQLRKNGFRGKEVQQRSVTPNRVSGSWPPSPVNDLGALLGGSSESKMHDRSHDYSSPRRSSILQEVNNSTSLRRSRARPRTDLVSIFMDENVNVGGEIGDSSRESSWNHGKMDSSPACLPADAPNLTKSKKKLQRSPSDLVRDAIMEEKEQYIEHLEEQLAATQTQLSSVTSPTVTQARSLKMRALNAQIRALQDELAACETRQHEREDLDSTLKLRVRSLEKEVEAYALNAKDLQHQLEQTKNSLKAAESANVELEKRLDTFANIVATSPQKQDFGFTPMSERRGHVRRQSALPRFPTQGSLVPPTNTLSFNCPPLPSIASAIAPPHSQSSISEEANAQQQQQQQQQEDQPSLETFTPSNPNSNANPTSEIDFAYTESASKRDSMLSTTSSRLSWTLPDGVTADAIICSSTGKAKPSRRMRRFHGGTLVPKPLILSSTAQVSLPPATAPPMETYDSPPAFPFPEVNEAARPRRLSFHESPVLRRRAYSSVDALTTDHFDDIPPLPGQSPERLSEVSTEDSFRHLASPQSAATESTPRHFSSIGSAVGRNLFEELRRVKTTETDTTATASELPGSSPPSRHSDSSHPALTRFPSNTSPSQLRQRRVLHHRSISEQTALPLRSRTRPVVGLPSLYSASQSSRTGRSHHTFSSTSSGGDKIVTIFSDLWRHPYSLARRCFERGERVMLFSNGVNKVSWWLLSFLLGPMVCRRIVSSAQPLLLSPLSARSWRKECRRKRKNGLDYVDHVDPSCPCHARGPPEQGLVARHSPWLWIKFSLTLAFAIGAAIRHGPASLLKSEWNDVSMVGKCTCSPAITMVQSCPSSIRHETKAPKESEVYEMSGTNDGANGGARSLAEELGDMSDDDE